MNNHVIENLHTLALTPTLEESKEDNINIKPILFICVIIDIIDIIYLINIIINYLPFKYFYLNAIWFIFGLYLKGQIIRKNPKKYNIIKYIIISHFLIGLVSLYIIFSINNKNQ